MTNIEAKKDMYNVGKCFTKGKVYQVNKDIHQISSLMDLQAINDQNEPHIIGSWWRNFEILTDLK